MAPGLEHLDVMPFRATAYNKKTKTMDFFDADHKDDFLFIDGTRIGELVQDGNMPPPPRELCHQRHGQLSRNTTRVFAVQAISCTLTVRSYGSEDCFFIYFGRQLQL